VDWSIFDFVGIDYYRDVHNRSTYGSRLKRYASFRKPVIITEFGCCTYKGAEDAGGRGGLIADQASGRLDGTYERDEALQARELADQLRTLHEAGVDGAFVLTFVSPNSPYDEDPARDLDMASYALVKTLADGRGATHPDIPWEPKESFKVVADYSKLQ
jgi:hypothetical protein